MGNGQCRLTFWRSWIWDILGNQRRSPRDGRINIDLMLLQDELLVVSTIQPGCSQSLLVGPNSLALSSLGVCSNRYDFEGFHSSQWLNSLDNSRWRVYEFSFDSNQILGGGDISHILPFETTLLNIIFKLFSFVNNDIIKILLKVISTCRIIIPPPPQSPQLNFENLYCYRCSTVFNCSVPICN